MRPPLPKEHGAWGMLFLPLLAALLTAPGGVAAWLIVPVVFFGYALREPLERTLRGRRDATTLGWLVGYALAAALCATLLVALTARTRWLAPAGAAGLLLLAGALPAAQRRSRSLTAELAGALGLPLSALVGALAAGGRNSLGLYLAFALYNLATVPYIRTWVLARRAERSERYQAEAAFVRRLCLATLALVVPVAALPALAGWQPPWVWATYLPGWARIVRGLRSAGRVEVPIQRLGWLEMAHSLAFCLLVALAYRMAG